MSGKQELGNPSPPFSSPPRCTRGSGKCCELRAAVALGTVEGAVRAARLQLPALVLSADKQCSGMGWVQQGGPAAAPRDRQCSGVLWLLTCAMHPRVPSSPALSYIVRWFFFQCLIISFFFPSPVRRYYCADPVWAHFPPSPAPRAR